METQVPPIAKEITKSTNNAFQLLGVTFSPLESIADKQLTAFKFEKIYAICLNIDTEEAQKFQRFSEDINWITQKAIEHENYIKQLHKHNLLPFKLGSIFNSIENIEKKLASEYQLLFDTLKFIEQKEEWSIKVYQKETIDIPEVDTPELQKLKQEIAEASPGKRFFLSKKLQKVKEKQGINSIQITLDNIHSFLLNKANAVLIKKNLSKEFTNKQEVMLSNFAVLLESKIQEPFLVELGKISSAHTTIELHIGGPFAVYHAVDFMEKISAHGERE